MIIIIKDLVLDVLSDIRLLSAQVDTVLATSFNWVLWHLWMTPLFKINNNPNTRVVPSERKALLSIGEYDPKINTMHNTKVNINNTNNNNNGDKNNIYAI